MRLRLLTNAETPEDAETDDDLITTEELAKMLRVDPSTVRRWRTAHPIQGPPFIALSERVIMYSIEDVRAWLASRRVTPEAA
jgi:predicted DNA-binding transcriptional regulator AlpA